MQIGRIAAAHSRGSSPAGTLLNVRGRRIERLNRTGNAQFSELRPSLYRGAGRYGSDAVGTVDGEPHASQARPPHRSGVCDGAGPEGCGFGYLDCSERVTSGGGQSGSASLLVRKWPRVRDGTVRPARLEALHEGRMTRRRGPLQPGSLPDFLAALSCRRGREGTDLPGLRLHRLNELLKTCGGGSVPVSVLARKTDASPSGADLLARRCTSTKSGQVAN